LKSQTATFLLDQSLDITTIMESNTAPHTLSSPRTTIGRYVLLMTLLLALDVPNSSVTAKLADRGRLVQSRKQKSRSDQLLNSRVYGTNTIPHRKIVEEEQLPIEGPKYRGKQRWDAAESNIRRHQHGQSQSLRRDESFGDSFDSEIFGTEFERELGSQLTGCCSNWKGYSADNLCYKYGQNCATGATPSHDSGDADCSMAGLSFIGISFSVNTASGNPYSYQLCDQFPMENLIDRNYDYVMSMDEDGWLVGGGYKSFDYSGKMPYIDSSHTELLRIGSLDTAYG
jgi:hypothetical protein